jgi:hypothetical protein
VVRNNRFATPQLLTQGLGFIGINDETVACSQLGSVGNMGDAAVSITAVQRGVGPNEDRFDYLFRYRGVNYSLDQLRQLLPLRLRVSESLLIGGTYTSGFVPVGDTNIDIGNLIFSTTSADTPGVLVMARAVTNPGHAAGYWQPDFLDFRDTPYGQSATGTATLVSNGQARLDVYQVLPAVDVALAFGFSFQSPPQSLNPGQSAQVRFTYTNNNPPVAPGPGPGGPPQPPRFEELLFTLVTNAGDIILTLGGAQIPPGPHPRPPHPVPGRKLKRPVGSFPRRRRIVR